MADIAANMFRLSSNRPLQFPKVDFGYLEQNTGARWHVSAGGTRAYLVRYAPTLDRNIEEQAFQGHFMMRRILASSLLAGAGLFQATATGRLLFRDVEGQYSWDAHLDISDFSASTTWEQTAKRIYDWLGALSQHNVLRRAAQDAHLALSNPDEAFVFVYRGFEWLVVGEGRTWADLAADLGVPESHLRDFKKTANVGLGVRHASASGKKLRAEVSNYGTWVAGLIEALNATRKRLQSTFTPMTPEEIGDAVLKAVPMVPFP